MASRAPCLNPTGGWGVRQAERGSSWQSRHSQPRDHTPRHRGRPSVSNLHNIGSGLVPLQASVSYLPPKRRYSHGNVAHGMPSPLPYSFPFSLNSFYCSNHMITALNGLQPTCGDPFVNEPPDTKETNLKKNCWMIFSHQEPWECKGKVGG